MISHDEIFSICRKGLEPKYFDPQLRPVVKFIANYATTYSAIPSVDQILAESRTTIQKMDAVTKDQVKYTIDEAGSFFRQKALELEILEAPALIREGKHGELEQRIKAAVAFTLKNELGIDLYKDGLAMIQKVRTADKPQPTGWEEFDELVDGGLMRKQMIMLSANSGGGKSIVMSNLGLNMAETFGLNVFYISLELSEEMVFSRFATMLSGVPTRQWRDNDPGKVIMTFGNFLGKKNHFNIKRMPIGTTPSQIKAYLKEYESTHNITPDVVIVDYLDLVVPDKDVDLSNISQRDKATSEEIYELGHLFNAIIVTASQQNRGGIDATHLTQAVIAGGISKLNILDVYASIILTDAMRASGKIALQFLKTRSSGGNGKSCRLNFSPTTLRITNDGEAPIQNTPVNIPTKTPSSMSLLELMA